MSLTYNFTADYIDNNDTQRTSIGLIADMIASQTITTAISGSCYVETTHDKDIKIFTYGGSVLGETATDDNNKLVALTSVMLIDANGFRYKDKVNQIRLLIGIRIYRSSRITVRTYYIYGNGTLLPIPKNIEEVAKILNSLYSNLNSPFVAMPVNETDTPQYILENLTSFHTDPVYSDATKINYTDGSYEVIRNRVLAEEEVKLHAYKNLLNSYGSFYRSTEREINTLEKKMSS